jgi:hypothetical protein
VSFAGLLTAQRYFWFVEFRLSWPSSNDDALLQRLAIIDKPGMPLAFQVEPPPRCQRHTNALSESDQAQLGRDRTFRSVKTCSGSW